MLNIIKEHYKTDTKTQFVCRIFRFMLSSINDLDKKLNLLVHKLKYGNSLVKVNINGTKMLLSLSDKGISQGLIGYGLWEQRATEIIKSIVKNGMTVLDIGANMGYFAMLESRLVGWNGIIYAIEPVLDNCELLASNIRINDIHNIDIFNLAAGDDDRKGAIYLSDRRNCGSMVYRGDINLKTTVPVNVVTINEFIKGKRLPDLVRMDVEGYEYEIIKGMSNLIFSKHPMKLLIELHPKYLGDKLRLLLGLLRDNGFYCKFATDRELESEAKLMQSIYYKLSDCINRDKQSKNGYYFIDSDLNKLMVFENKEIYPHVLFVRN